MKSLLKGLMVTVLIALGFVSLADRYENTLNSNIEVSRDVPMGSNKV